jgi:hypothetical protein
MNCYPSNGDMLGCFKPQLNICTRDAMAARILRPTSPPLACTATLTGIAAKSH